VSAISHALRVVGAPFRLLLIGLIRVYRFTLSGVLGGQCRFYPTCSRYGEEAIRVHGAFKGTLMATWRVLRCSPLTAGGVDHVPPKRTGHGAPKYDHVTQTPEVPAC
jgi:putative membrane protein insertion efficiency factor